MHDKESNRLWMHDKEHDNWMWMISFPQLWKDMDVDDLPQKENWRRQRLSFI